MNHKKLERVFSNFAELMYWLDRKGLFHMELGLCRMKAALRSLKIVKPAIAVQVLGTNGKGSVCSFLTALSRASGLRTGTYLSPHFVSPRERILIDGRPASEDAWLRGANEILANFPDADNLTYFEFLTLLALLIFRESNVQTYILEAGLGGKNDATSSLPVDARCFAPIAMDHAKIIGPRIEDIARDKSAVIDAGSFNFSAPQFPKAREILARAASDATLRFVEPLSPRRMKLQGDHQLANAALALECWKALFADADPGALDDAFIPGRLQFIREGEVEFILDGAHNPGATQNLARQLINMDIEPSSLIFSALADKDWRTSISILLNNFKEASVYIVELDNARAAKGSEIVAFLRRTRSQRKIMLTSFDESLALSASRGGYVLICGSLYLLSDFYSRRPEYLFQTDKEEE